MCGESGRTVQTSLSHLNTLEVSKEEATTVMVTDLSRACQRRYQAHHVGARRFKVYMVGDAGKRQGTMAIGNTSRCVMWWQLKTNHHNRLAASPSYGCLQIGETVMVS